LNNTPENIREHSYPDETYQIAIDFDGVIHKNSKGFYDGTIYDTPIDGAYEALESISKEFEIIVYTAKARKDRMLINGKTGTELVWEWLEKYDMKKFVSDVTAEKPRAVCYIDDKAIKFTNWNSALEEVQNVNRT
jgi:predicted phosphatase